ncbi:DUF3108 domain-containing protein [Alphaproteobacteria bacterium]|nr:DUF3108 domain-containing protein [Alphaproteobacteria bacterium]MDA8624733.1 DUF3108 domain-containing protein [Alphaproteobacteria bacterium]MDA8666709.1 DUF3108 domain-containing protein [Alphaproteobacteria bacterium]MDA8780154.1 DUF3108 domain-containing protein [Alphaproteobacteria bacterium]MDB2393709.1 DUF3108 domain-containing protein [Alphaproteobacteria bacterium]
MKLSLPFIIAALLASQSALAAESMRHFSAEYRLYVSGLLIGKADVHLSTSAQNYVLSAHMRPAGFGRIAGQSHVVSTTRGALQGGSFVPQRLDLSWNRDEVVKSSHMDYRDGAPLAFTSGYQQPEEFRSQNPISLEDVGPGSVDPFLGLLSSLDGKPLRAACEGTKRIFDGRRLATLTAQDAEFIPPFKHDFPQRRPAVKCSILWQPVAGYSKASLERASEFPPVQAHFGQIADTGFAAPLDMRGRSRYGRVTAYAVRYFTESVTPLMPFNMEEILKK